LGIPHPFCLRFSQKSVRVGQLTHQKCEVTYPR
jgi:hypothetical protein